MLWAARKGALAFLVFVAAWPPPRHPLLAPVWLAAGNRYRAGYICPLCRSIYKPAAEWTSLWDGKGCSWGEERHTTVACLSL